MKRTKFNTEAAKYVKAVKKRCSASHAASIERTLSSLSRAIGRNSVSRSIIVEWRDSMTGSPATVCQNIGIAKCFFSHLIEREVIETNPASDVRVPKKVQVRPYRAFTDGELGALLAGARRVDARFKRKWKSEWILRALAETGMRVGALSKVKWGDVNTGEAPSIQVRGETTKTGVGRIIPISRAYADSLAEQWATHAELLGRPVGVDQPAFRSTIGHHLKPGSVLSFLDSALKEAGIQKRDKEGAALTVHSLRHSFVTRLLRSGATVQEVMALSGHKSPDMVLSTYSHVTGEDARGAVDRLGDIGLQVTEAGEAFRVDPACKGSM